MADVELLIKMPEEYYKSIRDDAKEFLSKGMKVPSLYEIVIKGMSLPKGHERLMDADGFINGLKGIEKLHIDDELRNSLLDIINNNILVEADKGSEIKEEQDEGLKKDFCGSDDAYCRSLKQAEEEELGLD